MVWQQVNIVTIVTMVRSVTNGRRAVTTVLYTHSADGVRGPEWTYTTRSPVSRTRDSRMCLREGARARDWQLRVLR